MTDHVGGCLCGNIRFKLTGDPAMTAVCHCRNCQKTAGSAFSVVALAAAGALAIEGQPETYLDTADSGGKVERCFCPKCGSPIISKTEGLTKQGMVAIKAASFDDVSWLQPTVQVYCDSEQPWISNLANLPRVAKTPG
ncbi:GFA family protein [Polymorphobacter arshaanensis]|uniref:GFA family protein n=1 Tax=Glacieibacterium arshaanense TaxID=2511025 RepID=A0A4Y9ENQ2_9SPHN|nr:GFA family protein [Polymorphobacter arshaanensis]TFU03678.1 GFA family protein [Polymorphobacter arshaanensis]